MTVFFKRSVQGVRPLCISFHHLQRQQACKEKERLYFSSVILGLPLPSTMPADNTVAVHSSLEESAQACKATLSRHFRPDNTNIASVASSVLGVLPCS